MSDAPHEFADGGFLSCNPQARLEIRDSSTHFFPAAGWLKLGMVVFSA